jgi:hypothetical protein
MGKPGQTDPKRVNEVGGRADGMSAPTQITQAVQPLNGERQTREQPSDQQAVGMMMADMPQAMAVLSIIKALVLYFPSTLRLVVQDPAADLL